MSAFIEKTKKGKYFASVLQTFLLYSLLKQMFKLPQHTKLMMIEKLLSKDCHF